MEDGMNNEFLGDRRRALEEEYFVRLNRRLLDRLRAGEAAVPKEDGAVDSPGSRRNRSSNGAASKRSRHRS
jgi:hypothetical protein